MAATFLIDQPRDHLASHTNGNALPSLGADEVAVGARITTHTLRTPSKLPIRVSPGRGSIWSGQASSLFLSYPLACHKSYVPLYFARTTNNSQIIWAGLTLTLVASSSRSNLVWRFRSPWPGRLHRYDPGQRKSNQGAALYLLVPRSPRWPIHYPFFPPMPALRFCSNYNDCHHHLVSFGKQLDASKSFTSSPGAGVPIYWLPNLLMLID